MFIKTIEINKDNYYKMVVDERFLTVCPNPEYYNITQLISTFKIDNYLHNLEGPAMEHHWITPDFYYYIKGVQYNKKDWEKLSRGMKFDERMESILTS